MTNFETNFRDVLTLEAIRFCSGAVQLFSGPARANACGTFINGFAKLKPLDQQMLCNNARTCIPVLKRSQGRTGHMINVCISTRFPLGL